MGDKVAYLWGSPRDLSAQQDLSHKILHLVFRTIYLDVFNMSEKRMEEFAQKLVKFKPKAIIAYASAAYLFARFLQHREIKDIRPGAVITQAEKLLQEQRQLIEEIFDCEVFDFYGSREVSAMSAECPQHKGYHISAENVVLEFIKDNKPVPPGETGKILVTDLHNYAMPFIRYENGDLGVPSGEKCSCGRGLPLMHSVEGRITDTLVIGNKFISSPSLTLIFKDLPVKQYQLVQETESELTIKIVKTDEYTDNHTEQILKLMQTYVGSNVKLNLQFVSQIPPTKSGKYRFIISKVPVKF
ncbi:Phenylacetate-coenzyme A ligase [subsurface metagenome]